MIILDGTAVAWDVEKVVAFLATVLPPDSMRSCFEPLIRNANINGAALLMLDHARIKDLADGLYVLDEDIDRIVDSLRQLRPVDWTQSDVLAWLGQHVCAGSSCADPRWQAVFDELNMDGATLLNLTFSQLTAVAKKHDIPPHQQELFYKHLRNIQPALWSPSQVLDFVGDLFPSSTQSWWLLICLQNELDGRKLLKMTRETLASFTADYYIDQEDAELLLASAQLLRLYHIPKFAVKLPQECLTMSDLEQQLAELAKKLEEAKTNAAALEADYRKQMAHAASARARERTEAQQAKALREEKELRLRLKRQAEEAKARLLMMEEEESEDYMGFGDLIDEPPAAAPAADDEDDDGAPPLPPKAGDVAPALPPKLSRTNKPAASRHPPSSPPPVAPKRTVRQPAGATSAASAMSASGQPSSSWDMYSVVKRMPKEAIYTNLPAPSGGGPSAAAPPAASSKAYAQISRGADGTFSFQPSGNAADLSDGPDWNPYDRLDGLREYPDIKRAIEKRLQRMERVQQSMRVPSRTSSDCAGAGMQRSASVMAATSPGQQTKDAESKALGRFEAEKMLKEDGTAGAFVLRTSETKPNTLVLSMYTGARFAHCPITVLGVDKFHLAGQTFRSLTDLIKVHRAARGKLPRRLRKCLAQSISLSAGAAASGAQATAPTGGSGLSATERSNYIVHSILATEETGPGATAPAKTPASFVIDSSPADMKALDDIIQADEEEVEDDLELVDMPDEDDEPLEPPPPPTSTEAASLFDFFTAHQRRRTESMASSTK